MRHARRILLIGLLGAVSVFVVRVLVWRPFTVTGERRADRETRVSGVVHVHTRYSDGGATVEEIVAAAKTAALDYVVITDHNGFDAKPAAAYKDGVLVMVGTEISTESGHILALGLPEPAFRFSGDAVDAVDDIRELGGFAVAAHPTSARPDFRWAGWDLPGPWGIELLNGDSQWRAASPGRVLRGVATYGLNPRYALLQILAAPTEASRQWDRLLSVRDVPMLAGLDAHGLVRLTENFGLHLPSYEAMFTLAHNHVLLEGPLSGDAAADSAAVVAALADGRAYVGLEALAPAGGFFFVADQGDRQWTMGETARLSPTPRLRAGGQLPGGAELVLIRDGRVIAEGVGSLEWSSAETGVYRVEVRLPGWNIPWIVSNPIYVFDADLHASRQQRARWPSAEPPPVASRVLDDFNAGTVFEAVADRSTIVSGEMVDPVGGADGSGAARLDFKLGTPTSDTPSPFRALVSMRKRDLSDGQGLVLSIKGDGVYRIWIQLRDRNPDSEEGTEWWFASVRTSTTWRRVAVPFSRFRTRDSHTDGQLDLDDTMGVLFVIDTGAVKPGTAGVIWIDDVAVY